jgi:hypothetical protein
MPLLRALAALIFLCSATAASATDVCLIDPVNEAAFVLKKLKVPKRPNDAVPVSGIGITGTSANGLPVSGTLIRDVNGDLILGLTRHLQRCLIGGVLDESLNGTVSYDCNLDNANDTTGSIALIDCDELFPVKP